MILTILGAPGAGKGTMAKELSNALGIPTVSTGALLRNEISSGSHRGKMIDALISDGNFVPDEVIVEILKDRLKGNDCKNGYILDGFPRNVSQATHLKDYGINLDKVLVLDVSESEIIERLVNRRECKECRATYHIISNPPKKEGICDDCGGELVKRPDDEEFIIRKRLQIYEKETQPLVDFFKKLGMVIQVKGKSTVEETKKDVFYALGVDL